MQHAQELQHEQQQVSTADAGALPPMSAVGEQKSLPPGAAVQQQTDDSVPQISQEAPESRLVHVKTDVLDVIIDRKGGNIVGAKLLKYLEEYEGSEPVQILDDSPDNIYVAQSGLLGKFGPDTQEGQAVFKAPRQDYVMSEGQNDLSVDLSWKKNGVNITKIFRFNRGKYDFAVDYAIDNQSSKEWKGNFYAQIRRHKEGKKGKFGLNTYQGPAISSPAKPYEKIRYKKMDKQDLSRSIEGGWVASQQRYFVTAWVPNQKQTNHYFSRADGKGVYTLGFVGPELKVAPGTKATEGGKFYVGPELEENLKPLAPHLELTIDYGWLWMVSSAIFWVMSKIYSVIGNWGWSIILVTLLIKLAFYKLSATSYRSMAKMRDLQPRLELLKQRYGKDKQKMSKATMELYRTEKVNPLGGCLPMLIQIPVFIALYYVLIESIHLRHAPFVLWIHDLSSKDPYYILPVLMGVSMFLQQLLNPPPPDPMQAKLMKYGMPIFFTVFFMQFPSGLVLYWLANNCLSILQQWYIMKKFSK